MGNGSPFTQPYSALNKINKTYLSTLSAGDNFFFYERKKISFEKQQPSVHITDISKNLLHAFEIQEEQQSLYCFESGRGEISLPRMYFIYSGASLSLSRFPIPGCCSVVVKSCRKGFNKAGSMFTPLTMEAHIKY